MDELERRLRSALTDMAGEVPASTDAWGEHERRMARRGRQARRRPILVVAAAAAVAALIMVPVLVFNSRGGGGGDDLTAANRPPETSVSTPSTKIPSSGVVVPQTKATYQPGVGETIVIGPVSLMTEQSGGGGYRSLYGLVLNAKGETMYCTAEGKTFTTGIPRDDAVTKRACSPLRPPKPGKVFWGKFQVSTVADNMGGFVFLAAKNTHHVVVRADNGTYATADRMGSGTDFDLFFTYISGKTITNYTAKDAAGQTLEDA
ncbi:hypothetical protein [Actinocrispum sp. NPDC049592]|uniref:hypothetical protein n=1 Tax=Actinocrispum sp. NPDC049592 TaxID=3154835 RepID=UPI0034276A45